MKSPPPLVDNKDELWNDQFAQCWPIITLKGSFSSLQKSAYEQELKCCFVAAWNKIWLQSHVMSLCTVLWGTRAMKEAFPPVWWPVKLCKQRMKLLTNKADGCWDFALACVP
jgi:hypothetical protein